MRAILLAGLSTISALLAGCSGLRALDQAAADMAQQTPACTHRPTIGVDDYGGKTCSVSHTIWSTTTTTVQEQGKPAVTTRTTTTRNGTTTEVLSED